MLHIILFIENLKAYRYACAVPERNVERVGFENKNKIELYLTAFNGKWTVGSDVDGCGLWRALWRKLRLPVRRHQNDILRRNV